MTEQEFIDKLAPLEFSKEDGRLQAVTCALIGHSRIINMCFGQVTCARCDALLGDALMGLYDSTNKVIVGHDCSTCHQNYKALEWTDKIFCPDPFAKDEQL